MTSSPTSRSATPVPIIYPVLSARTGTCLTVFSFTVDLREFAHRSPIAGELLLIWQLM